MTAPAPAGEATPGLKALATHNGLAYLLSCPFKKLTIGGVTVSDPDVMIQTNTRQWPDLILGTSVLRQLDFCVAYDPEKLFVHSSGVR